MGNDTKFKLFPPYRGQDDYIVVSYPYSDEAEVFEDIERFQAQGFNVFYKNETTPKSDTANAINDCSLYVIFITHNPSKDIKKEIESVLNLKKNILPIFLSKAKIDNMVDYYLSGIRSINKYELSDEEYIFEYLRAFKSYGLEPDDDPTHSRLIPGIGREPLPAYRGKYKYIFVSYAHKDAFKVFPEIKRFQDMGYNIWYDEGISIGNEWKNDVVDHLYDCDLFIVFVTNNSANSLNVKKEINYAIDKGKPIIPIYLEDFDEIKMDKALEYELANIQGILKTTMDDDEYIFKFTNACKNFGFEVFRFSNSFVSKSISESELNSTPKLNGLEEYIDAFFNDYLIYDKNDNAYIFKDIFMESVHNFINNQNSYWANEVYNNFFSIYEMFIYSRVDSDVELSKQDYVRNLVKTIQRFEDNANNSRDNFVHSVNVFILGLALYSQNRRYRNSFKRYLAGNDFSHIFHANNQLYHEEFFFGWGITSLFHDLCFSVESSEKRLKESFYNNLKNILGYDRNSFNRGVAEFNVVPIISTNFSNSFSERHLELDYVNFFKPTDLIAQNIARNFELDGKQLINNFNYFMNFMEEKDFVDHGVLSSIIVLNAYGETSQECQQLAPVFYGSVVDSATAIFLHNYYGHVLCKEPFNLERLRCYQSPLLFLLLLCDELLETSVDDISFSINDEYLNVKYEIKSSVNGFGAHDKNAILEDLLSLKDIFAMGISIITKLYDNIVFEIKNRTFKETYVEPSAVSIERIAKGIFYRALDNNEKLRQDISSFDELPSDLKRLYFKSASDIVYHVSFLGYEIVDDEDDRKSVMSFDESETDALARLSHQLWCDEKWAFGWTYGDMKNLEKLITPYLVPWDELPPEIQAYDIDPIRTLPHTLSSMGLKIVHSKISLLTFRLHQFSLQQVGLECGDIVEEFYKLSQFSQEVQRHETKFIVELLLEYNYHIVDADSYGNPIRTFTGYEIEYFAKRKFESWYEYHINLGWRYGDLKDESSKTNPLLVPWHHLDDHAKRLEMDTIVNLPEMCESIGLKIVKK